MLEKDLCLQKNCSVPKFYCIATPLPSRWNSKTSRGFTTAGCSKSRRSCFMIFKPSPDEGGWTYSN